MPTDQELKQQLALALDATLEPMHELERRGYTVGIWPHRLSSCGCADQTVFSLKVYKQTTEEL